MSSPVHSEIRRRRVFYLPGYDPIHPRRYRELYRREGRAQAKISGYVLDLTGRVGQGNRARPGGGTSDGQGARGYGWRVNAVQDGAPVNTDFDVLVWSDIVRASMDHGIARTYWIMARTAWTYLATGTLARLMRLRKGPVIAALYPVGMLLLQAVAAVFAGLLVALIVTWAMGWLGQAAGFGVRLADKQWIVAGLLGALGALAVLTHFRNVDNRLYVYYLMHDYAYSAAARGANPPELEARIKDFAMRIADALEEDLDEVLVVGHSSGAHLAVSVLADLHRQGRIPAHGPRLALLTLGQVVPMVSFLPDADRLRADLAYLSAADIPWVDVTAPGDGCAFALCDPVAVSGVAPAGKRWPLVISAAFTQTLSPDRWKSLRWRFFRLHFQYLCAFDRPGDYDYFRITAGPLSLETRYRDRAPSASRIETPVSKYTGTRP
ncbi:MAG TPA: hypothetical protein DIU07_22170 [Rhodobacteraceae bacterium]|nr:hypothetical protein [Paracoccaceae bacterium]